MPDTLDLIWIILVLGLVFYLAWLVTRLVAVRARGKAAGRMMRVVDRLNIANDKCILLVKVASEYCVIGVTGHEMRLIRTLPAEQADALDAEAETQAWAGGSPADGVVRGFRTFSERLGFAIRRPGPRPGARSQDAEPGEGQGDGGPSVIDMMNERIKIRKDSRRK